MVHLPDRFIASCNSWDDFWDRTRTLSSKADKGRAFERLTQLYLQTAPEYRTKLQHVWLLRDVPADIRKQVNLPGPDEGIDLVARTRRGEYWAIRSPRPSCINSSSIASKGATIERRTKSLGCTQLQLL
jgi:predicted helicase